MPLFQIYSTDYTASLKKTFTLRHNQANFSQKGI